MLVASGALIGSKARHFALHGLIAVFPDADRKELATMVGFLSGAGQALAASMRMPNTAKWWAAGVLTLVVRKIQAVPAPVRGASALAEAESTDVAPMPQNAPAGSVGARPARLVDVPLEPVERPTMAQTFRRAPYPLPGTGSKQGLRDMLAEAMRNTAAMAPPAED